MGKIVKMENRGHDAYNVYLNSQHSSNRNSWRIGEGEDPFQNLTELNDAEIQRELRFSDKIVNQSPYSVYPMLLPPDKVLGCYIPEERPDPEEAKKQNLKRTLMSESPSISLEGNESTDFRKRKRELNKRHAKKYLSLIHI
eukprot:TRINITY_DN11511_c0_g1_i1.p2 TRINITY_DN11511_c0_g1~~TRINITY_DN11511_c0_g1_i1.p2  ORF type:complete len:141 (+),score=20.55 TRINITY_DN11511_c0_g1_i1:224-646(+)